VERLKPIDAARLYSWDTGWCLMHAKAAIGYQKTPEHRWRAVCCWQAAFKRGLIDC
jgi:hypothetical protein